MNDDPNKPSSHWYAHRRFAVAAAVAGLLTGGVAANRLIDGGDHKAKVTTGETSQPITNPEHPIQIDTFHQPGK